MTRSLCKCTVFSALGGDAKKAARYSGQPLIRLAQKLPTLLVKFLVFCGNDFLFASANCNFYERFTFVYIGGYISAIP